jgi:hypothetical protein
MGRSDFNERLLNYAEEVLRSAGRPLTSKAIIASIKELQQKKAKIYKRYRHTTGKRYEVAPQKLTQLMRGDRRFIRVGYAGKNVTLWGLVEWDIKSDSHGELES